MKCSKCGGVNDREGQRWCRACMAAYARVHRKKHSELSHYERLKSNARAYLNTYIKRGKIKRLPCEVCGVEPTQGHHDDYTKPLEVRWLCRDHHDIHHQQRLAEAPEEMRVYPVQFL